MDDKRIDRLDALAKEAAAALSGALGSDVRQTIEGGLASAIAAAAVGTTRDSLAALRCLGLILVAVSDREAAFNTDAEARQAAFDLRQRRLAFIRNCQASVEVARAAAAPKVEGGAAKETAA